MRSLDTAATGMLAQQLNVEVISNNIANMNTTGFKRQRAEFEDLLYQNIELMGTTSADDGSTVPTGIQVGVGVKAGGVYRITEQGGLGQTGNRFDFAIQGDGYFVVQMPDGTQGYTRAGNFSANQNGEIVNMNGYVVSPGIVIPEEAVDISVNAQGLVQAITADNTVQDLGQFDLARFINPAGLEAVGENMFRETVASGVPNLGLAGNEAFGTLQQGFLEGSNVNAVAEITALISAQRAYEMNSKVITASDEMLSVSSQLR